MIYFSHDTYDNLFDIFDEESILFSSDDIEDESVLEERSNLYIDPKGKFCLTTYGLECYNYGNIAYFKFVEGVHLDNSREKCSRIHFYDAQYELHYNNFKLDYDQRKGLMKCLDLPAKKAKKYTNIAETVWQVLIISFNHDLGYSFDDMTKYTYYQPDQMPSHMIPLNLKHPDYMQLK